MSVVLFSLKGGVMLVRQKAPTHIIVEYSLHSELLVAEMDVSRRILVLDTSISATSNSERREYSTMICVGAFCHTSMIPPIKLNNTGLSCSNMIVI